MAKKEYRGCHFFTEVEIPSSKDPTAIQSLVLKVDKFNDNSMLSIEVIDILQTQVPMTETIFSEFFNGFNDLPHDSAPSQSTMSILSRCLTRGPSWHSRKAAIRLSSTSLSASICMMFG